MAPFTRFGGSLLLLFWLQDAFPSETESRSRLSKMPSCDPLVLKCAAPVPPRDGPFVRLLSPDRTCLAVIVLEISPTGEPSFSPETPFLADSRCNPLLRSAIHAALRSTFQATQNKQTCKIGIQLDYLRMSGRNKPYECIQTDAAMNELTKSLDLERMFRESPNVSLQRTH